MRKLVFILACLFFVLAVLALAIYLIGNFGLFGAETSPLAGVYLIILGQPWVQFVDFLPSTLRIWAAAATPFINSGLLFLLARLLATKASA
jgi:hypothetical protein